MAFAPTIYSIGDATFLAQVLNAVAMIMGTNDFVRLVSIGLLLGVLTVVLQGLFRGAKEIPWSQLLLGWMLYACMFVPTTTVIIEDSYTSRARPVDNVPIGVAFAGSMISNLGYGITVLFETAYSDVASATKRPFAEPLQIVNALREHSADEYVIQRLNAAIGPGTDMGKTLENYVKECSMPKLALRIVTPSDMNTQDALEVMEFNSNVYGTQIFVNNSDGEQLTCKDAWAKIKPALDKVKDPAVITELSRAANLKGDNGPATIDDYSNAFDALNIDSNAVENFILVSLIKPIYEKGGASYLKSVGDRTAALMFNQAVMQRNSQWATEASMFMTVVRPFISFFEGFIFAVTPVLAFLLVLGGVGISLGMKYMLLILWIQLWMPVLSIINLYIIMSARGALANQSFTSFYSIDNCALALENWIATGGMLAAATPLISLFLITGSTFAFTSLTQRMAGADHINEKLHSPDAKSQGAFYAHDSAGNGNSLLGAHRVGSEGTEGSVTVSEQNSKALASANSKMIQDSNQLNNLYNKTYSSGNEAKFVGAFSESMGNTLQSSRNKGIQAVAQAVRTIGENRGWSASQISSAIDQVTASLAATGGLQKLIKKFPIKGDLTASTGGADNLSQSITLSDSEQKQIQNAFQTTNSAELAEGRSAALAKQNTDSWAKNYGISNQNQVGQVINSAISSGKNYQEVKTHTSALSVANNATMQQLAGMKNKASDSLFGTISNAYQGTAIQQEAERIAGQKMEFNGMSQEMARKVGLLTALGRSGDAKDQANFRSLVSAATGLSLQPAANASENAGIAQNVQKASSADLPDPETIKQDALRANQAPSKIEQLKKEISGAEAGVRGDFTKQTAGVLAEQAKLNKQWDNKAITNAREGLKHNIEGMTIGRPYTGTQSQLLAESVQAGLTDGQAMAAVHLKNNQPELANQILMDENRRLYGDSMNSSQIEELSTDMQNQLSHALKSGNQYQVGVMNISSWNSANTPFGSNPTTENTMRLTRSNEEHNRAPTDLIAPPIQDQLNSLRGLPNNAHLPTGFEPPKGPYATPEARAVGTQPLGNEDK